MLNLLEFDWWEDKGLVRSLFVDGLNFFEFFNYVIVDWIVIFRKYVEVV